MKRGEKYPIVYAIMEINDYTDWNTEEKVAYIVSKSYLVNDRIVYSGDGSEKKKYSVVFPYRNIEDIRQKNKHYPEYGIGNYEECFNSISVDDIFHNYEEAKEKAKFLNKELLRQQTSKVSLENMEKVIDAFNRRFRRYKILEELIDNETCDMNVVELEESKVKLKTKE